MSGKRGRRATCRARSKSSSRLWTTHASRGASHPSSSFRGEAGVSVSSMTRILPAMHRLDAEPWYRQRWPWFLIAGPAIVVVAALFTAWLAASTDDGVIADDYYKRGLMINKELDRTARAEALRLGAVVTFAPDGSVRLALDGDAPPEVMLTLGHPTRAGYDRAITLMRGADGVYAGRLDAPRDGRRHVAVETATWRLTTTTLPGDATEVRLGAAREVD